MNDVDWRPGPLCPLEDVPHWLHPLVVDSAEIEATAFGWPRSRPPAHARPAAVLLLFGAGTRGPDIVLLRRADGLNSHPGQVAFPGGGIDPTDRGPVDAALREAAEEVGLRPAGVRPLALLPELHVPHSGFRVSPVVAHWEEPSEVRPVDPGETAAVARVSIARLTDPAYRVRVGRAGAPAGPAFLVPGMLVWGFTAGVLAGVLDLAGWTRPWDSGDVWELTEAWHQAERAGAVDHAEG
ncbi:CoA pyrophosphatase [Salinifilum aidingensis]